jgi:hypothetical protein
MFQTGPQNFNFKLDKFEILDRNDDETMNEDGFRSSLTHHFVKREDEGMKFGYGAKLLD